MKAYVCDRCHKMYPTQYRKALFKLADKVTDRWLEFDMCQDCQEDLIKWWMTPPELKKKPDPIEVEPLPEVGIDGFTFKIDI